ncbi:hypothetical protein AX14_011950 [Amanita brunnescens Koide BX004]|nr:hypothetical protein AX14_011950 [Amanita brunnescens Koide BX004]
MFDQSKFFGLHAPDGHHIWFLPGKRDGVTGYSPGAIWHDHSEESDEEEAERRETAKEIELAQQFDLKLTQASQGAILVVEFTKWLCGWQASMLKGSFEYSQYLEAIQTLPMSHPAYRAIISDMSECFRARARMIEAAQGSSNVRVGVSANGKWSDSTAQCRLWSGLPSARQPRRYLHLTPYSRATSRLLLRR